jgi:NAD(P)H dehydrogenase (quinone)
MNLRQLIITTKVVALGAVVLLTDSPIEAAESLPSVTMLIAYHSSSGNTDKMAQGVADGARKVSGIKVLLKRVGDVTAEDLLSSDALVVGSPVYFGNMAGEVKTFFDNWNLKFQLSQDRKMVNKVGAAFATAASISNGKEVTVLTILAAMLLNQMIVVSGGGGFGATATTGPASPGIDDRELAEASELGRRVAEVASVVKRGSNK